MIRFKTDFDAVSGIQIHDPSYAVIFDNKGNVLGIFPRGKYDFPFWYELMTDLIHKMDFELYQIALCGSMRGRKFRKQYREFFLSHRNDKLKKAFQVVENLDKVRPGGSIRRQKSSVCKQKDKSAA